MTFKTWASFLLLEWVLGVWAANPQQSALLENEADQQANESGREQGRASPAGSSVAVDSSYQPQKAALMIVTAHPDDEVYNFGGAITYYSVVRKLPVVLICMTSEPKLREDELRCACRKYGMRNEPIFGRFSNCCYGGTVEENWEKWGGREKVVGYLTEQIRRYKPDVLLGHDLKGELRAHPNHICSALALIDAYRAASDKNKFPEQLAELSPWQAKKLYLHFYEESS